MLHHRSKVAALTDGRQYIVKNAEKKKYKSSHRQIPDNGGEMRSSRREK